MAQTSFAFSEAVYRLRTRYSLHPSPNTIGINSIRIYNPIKQGIDHDPVGTFIRRWIPELRDINQEYIQMPWQAKS